MITHFEAFRNMIIKAKSQTVAMAIKNDEDKNKTSSAPPESPAFKKPKMTVSSPDDDDDEYYDEDDAAFDRAIDNSMKKMYAPRPSQYSN
jgi:hypothetical protein